MADLLFQHGGHLVRHGPHALADLGVARQATADADVHVPVLVGLDPRRLLHLALGDHRAGLHAGVDLITGAVEEASVDEDHARLRGLDAGLEVDGGAALLVHDADLEGVARQPEGVFDGGKELIGEAHLVRAVHLRLHDVDGTRARVALAIARRGVGLEIVHGAQRRHEAVHDAFEDLVAIGVEDRRVGHQMPNIAHEEQAAAVQAQLAAVGRGVEAVLVEDAGDGLVALGHLLGQCALHQAQPVAVHLALVGGIDRRHRVLAVHDRADGGFHQQILDAGLVGLADGARRIDLDFDVQAVVLEQDRGRLGGIAHVADELGRGL